jgi:hypothetical protein
MWLFLLCLASQGTSAQATAVTAERLVVKP